MPDLREAILKEYLRTRRLGFPIRASLTAPVFHTITSLKEETRRTYREIFLVILNIFKHHPNFFPIDAEKKSRQDLFFRLAKRDSMTVLVWAWKRNQRRSNFIGDITEQFLEMVPLTVFKDALINRKDQALRLKEDFEKYERSGKNRARSRAE